MSDAPREPIIDGNAERDQHRAAAGAQRISAHDAQDDAGGNRAEDRWNDRIAGCPEVPGRTARDGYLPAECEERRDGEPEENPVSEDDVVEQPVVRPGQR